MPTRHIVAREYEFLVPEDAGRSNCHAAGADGFAALREFVLANKEDDNSLDLMRLCSPRGIGEAIQLQNYVGVVELSDGLQVEILPKIDISPESGVSDREVFVRMLAELGSDLTFKMFERAELASGEAPLFEVFVRMFLEETSDLVRRGIRSSYVTVESEERFIRGKINFARESKKNPARALMTNLIHDELLPDTPENRLVKTALIYLRRSSRDGRNLRSVARLLPAFEDIGVSRNIDADLARCVRSRLTRNYEVLLSWCRIFLSGESFTMFRGDAIATALLFPMESIFQDYVGKMLRRYAMHDGALRRVELQATGQWLFEGHRVSLRPDILCECNNGRRVVLDTKWKRINGPGDLSVADMHQMYAYGQRYRSESENMQHVVLLYPWHRDIQPGMMRSGRHVSSDGVQVGLFFIDLSNIQRSLRELLALVADPTTLEK